MQKKVKAKKKPIKVAAVGGVLPRKRKKTTKSKKKATPKSNKSTWEKVA